MKRSNNPDKFLTLEEKKLVEKEIQTAELKTSAEIKVVITRHCWKDIREKALQVFANMNLHKTAKRNCVLIMLVIANREFVIFGDEGIHKKAGQELWNSTRNKMLDCFRENNFGQGLATGVKAIGEKLGEFFPYESDDVNEISNEVEYHE